MRDWKLGRGAAVGVGTPTTNIDEATRARAVELPAGPLCSPTLRRWTRPLGSESGEIFLISSSIRSVFVSNGWFVGAVCWTDRLR